MIRTYGLGFRGSRLEGRGGGAQQKHLPQPPKEAAILMPDAGNLAIRRMPLQRCTTWAFRYAVYKLVHTAR